MPRAGRVLLSNYAHNILQRGHNRQMMFPEPHDFLYYLDTLRDWKTLYDVKVYAYCLMTNHVHLVLAPRKGGRTISAHDKVGGTADTLR